jgi:DNA repair exonuclease SbcCD nuclease subunit
MAWDFYQSRPPFDTFQKHSTDGFHIAVVHGTLAGSRYSEAHSREVPLDPRNLANSGMDYIALGHIHYYQKVQAGEIPVVYPGTLECRRFTPGEENDRFLVVVKLEKNQPPVFKQIKWNKKTFLQLTFDLGRLSVGSQDELVEFILQRCRGIDKVVRIELLGESSFLIDTEKLISRLSGDFFWLTIEDKTQVFNNFIIENWVQEDTIRGLCIRKLKQHLQSVQTEDEKNRINLALKLAVHSFQKTK